MRERTRRDRQPRAQRRRDLDPRRRRAAGRLGLRDPDPRPDPRRRATARSSRPRGGSASICAPRCSRSAFTPPPTTARDGLAPRTDLGGLNLSRVPKVFVEVANMQDRADEAPMERPAYRERVAHALLAGLERFLRRAGLGGQQRRGFAGSFARRRPRAAARSRGSAAWARAPTARRRARPGRSTAAPTAQIPSLCSSRSKATPVRAASASSAASAPCEVIVCGVRRAQLRRQQRARPVGPECREQRLAVGGAVERELGPDRRDGAQPLRPREAGRRSAPRRRRARRGRRSRRSPRESDSSAGRSRVGSAASPAGGEAREPGAEHDPPARGGRDEILGRERAPSDGGPWTSGARPARPARPAPDPRAPPRARAARARRGRSPGSRARDADDRVRLASWNAHTVSWNADGRCFDGTLLRRGEEGYEPRGAGRSGTRARPSATPRRSCSPLRRPTPRRRAPCAGGGAHRHGSLRRPQLGRQPPARRQRAARPLGAARP